MRLLTEADLDREERDVEAEMVAMCRQMGRDVMTYPRRFWRRLILALLPVLTGVALFLAYWALYLVRVVSR